MVLKEKLYQSEQKGEQSIGIKFFYLNTSYSFEYKKSCIGRLPVKIFIKKNRARNTPAYQLLLSIRTLATYKKIFLTSRWSTVSIPKQLSLDRTPFLAGHCRISGDDC